MTNDEIRQHIEMLLADSKTRQRDIELLYESVSKLADAAREQRENITKQGENIASQGENIASQGENIASQGKNISALIRAAEIDAENIRRLANIAEAHERRLSNLEGDENNREAG